MHDHIISNFFGYSLVISRNNCMLRKIERIQNEHIYFNRLLSRSIMVSTIFSAYENAENKDNLIFSICDQSDNAIKVNEIKFSKQIHYDHVDPLFSKGPCWARHRIQSFFNDEDFFLQIDSHTQFAPNWGMRFYRAIEKIMR